MELIRFGIQLVWFRKVTLIGLCLLYTVYCTVYIRIHLVGGFYVFCTLHRIDRELGFFSSHPNWDSPTPSPARRRVSSPPPLVRGGGGGHTHLQNRDHLVQRRQISKSTKVTLRPSWYDCVNLLYGVKKICLKWLWPVKVTLKVIKRRLKVFCWSCDGVPLKWNRKKLPSLQFVITDQMSLLSPLNSNDRSIPFNLFVFM